ncbi:glycosyltransferase family 1 protein, partial [Nocardioides antri]
MSPFQVVHAVVPAGIDDPSRPSGGNRYDRRVLDELAGLGWQVQQHRIPGTWPDPSPADVAALDQALAELPDGAPVLVDGLIGSAAAAVLGPPAARLRGAVRLPPPPPAGGREELRPRRPRRAAAV